MRRFKSHRTHLKNHREKDEHEGAEQTEGEEYSTALSSGYKSRSEDIQIIIKLRPTLDRLVF